MTRSPGHVVVAGAGAFGSAAALELRRRGWDVTLVDPGPLPRPEASSTDDSKLVRMEYGSDVFHHELAEAALEGWDRWNADWPRPLYHEHGLLLLAAAAMSPGGFEHESLRLLEARGYAPERVGPADLAAHFPEWRGDVYPDGFFNPRAGWAESGEVVRRLVELCRGAGVLGREAIVRSVHAAGSRIAGVVLEGGERMSADRVVVAAGAWTPSLLPWLADVMWPTAQPVLYLAPEAPARFRGPTFPPWGADITHTGWYGFPALADGRVKIGHHGPGRRVAPGERGGVAAEHEARCRAFLRGAIPRLADAPLAGSRVCMYCDTFDGDFLIGEDPEREGLVVASGGSGHGFKFAPVLGGLIADAVEGRGSRWSTRFAWRSPSERRTEASRFDG